MVVENVWDMRKQKLDDEHAKTQQIEERRKKECHRLLTEASPFTMQIEHLPPLPPGLTKLMDFDSRVDGVFRDRKTCCHKYMAREDAIKGKCRLCAMYMRTTPDAIQPFVQATIITVQMHYNKLFRYPEDVGLVHYEGSVDVHAATKGVSASQFYHKKLIIREDVETAARRLYVAMYSHRDFGKALAAHLENIILSGEILGTFKYHPYAPKEILSSTEQKDEKHTVNS